MTRHSQTPFWGGPTLTFGLLLVAFRVNSLDFFHVFPIVFSFTRVVEAAPQARPKTTAVANTVSRPFPGSPPFFNAFPVPLLRQVFCGSKQIRTVNVHWCEFVCQQLKLLFVEVGLSMQKRMTSKGRRTETKSQLIWHHPSLTPPIQLELAIPAKKLKFIPGFQVFIEIALNELKMRRAKNDTS